MDFRLDSPAEGMREVSGRGIGGCSIAQLPPCGLKGNPLSGVGALCHAMRRRRFRAPSTQDRSEL